MTSDIFKKAFRTFFSENKPNQVIGLTEKLINVCNRDKLCCIKEPFSHAIPLNQDYFIIVFNKKEDKEVTNFVSEMCAMHTISHVERDSESKS